MRLTKLILLSLFISMVFVGCAKNQAEETENFKFLVDRFEDLRVLQYRVPGFDELTPKQKELAYYLSQACHSGRDISWDQHYKHNLYIRRTLENIVQTYNGNKNTPEFEKFMTFVKRVWFSNGIHHHYGSQKFDPGFSFEYFIQLVKNSDQTKFPLTENEKVEDLLNKLNPILFDPEVDKMRVNNAAGIDIVKTSAVNFYEGVTQKEVEDYYKKIIDPKDATPVSYGINAKVVKENGQVTEKVWKVGGMYTGALEKMVYWLEKAITVAENDTQKKWLELLVEYFKTGDLRKFDEFNIVWAQDNDSMIDMVLGFIEFYGDPMGYKGSYEGIVSIKDLEASKRTGSFSDNAQWFEDNSPTMKEHKKEKVKGVLSKVITMFGNAGDSYPAAPAGINLPNANWIRANHGSKSVTMGNTDEPYEKANPGGGMGKEFTYSEEELEFNRKYGDLPGTLVVDLHEIIGHASGKINPGVGTPKETLKNYANTLEESRADLFALYYIMDQKLVDLGIAPSTEVGKIAYNGYIQRGLLTQITRIRLGDKIQQTHMKNRSLVSHWVYEQGKKDNVIEKKIKDGKTFFVVNDYVKLRELFGQLLKEVQRIKSEGDFEAAKHLVETYGVNINYDLHKEVLERYASLNMAPYSGMMTPVLVPVKKDGKIVDVKLEFHDDFVKQNLWLSKEYSFLPTYN